MTTQAVRPSQTLPDTHNHRAGADPDLLDGQAVHDTQVMRAVEDQLPGDQGGSDTHPTPVAGDQTVRPSQSRCGIQESAAGADLDLLDGQSKADIHRSSAVEDQLPGQGIDATHQDLAGTTSPAGTNDVARPRGTSSRLADVHLLLAAEAVDDLERTRIANENRLRALRMDYGLEGTPEERQAEALVDALAKLEHQATLNLNRVMRKHPLGPWVARTIGVGEKQAARLLAAIGDPFWNSLHDRPRTVSELWAYSGYHTVIPASHTRSDAHTGTAGGDKLGDTDHHLRDAQSPTVGVAAKRRKGQKANWSDTAKMRAFLIATSCIKQANSPYRAVYDARRAHTAETHPVVAKNPVYPEWTPGHSHNDALRIVAKTVLRDLWREARSLREGT